MLVEPNYLAFRFGDYTPQPLIIRRSVIGFLGFSMDGKWKWWIPTVSPFVQIWGFIIQLIFTLNLGEMYEEHWSHYPWDAPCMEYSLTFTLGEMQVNILYMEHLGLLGHWVEAPFVWCCCGWWLWRQGFFFAHFNLGYRKKINESSKNQTRPYYKGSKLQETNQRINAIPTRLHMLLNIWSIPMTHPWDL